MCKTFALSKIQTQLCELISAFSGNHFCSFYQTGAINGVPVKYQLLTIVISAKMSCEW